MWGRSTQAYWASRVLFCLSCGVDINDCADGLDERARVLGFSDVSVTWSSGGLGGAALEDSKLQRLRIRGGEWRLEERVEGKGGRRSRLAQWSGGTLTLETREAATSLYDDDAVLARFAPATRLFDFSYLYAIGLRAPERVAALGTRLQSDLDASNSEVFVTARDDGLVEYSIEDDGCSETFVVNPAYNDAVVSRRTFVAGRLVRSSRCSEYGLIEGVWLPCRASVDTYGESKMWRVELRLRAVSLRTERLVSYAPPPGIVITDFTGDRWQDTPDGILDYYSPIDIDTIARRFDEVRSQSEECATLATSRWSERAAVFALGALMALFFSFGRRA